MKSWSLNLGTTIIVGDNPTNMVSDVVLREAINYSFQKWSQIILLFSPLHCNKPSQRVALTIAQDKSKLRACWQSIIAHSTPQPRAKKNTFNSPHKTMTTNGTLHKARRTLAWRTNKIKKKKIQIKCLPIFINRLRCMLEKPTKLFLIHVYC